MLEEYFRGDFRISYSAFKGYLACPYQFYLNEQVKQIKPRPKRVTDSRNFLDGWVAHKCLELWARKGIWEKGWMSNVVVVRRHSPKGYLLLDVAVRGEFSEANLVESVTDFYLEKNFVRWKTKNDRKESFIHIVKGLRKLEELMVRFDLNSPQVQSEKWFKVKLERLNVTVAGAIDLFDYRPYHLYDMKFSKGSYMDWEQLKFYDMMMTIHYNRKIGKVYTLNPLHPKPLKFKEFSKEDLKELMLKLEGIISKIREGKFEPRPGSACYMCAVKERCEFGGYYSTVQRDIDVKMVDGKKKAVL